MASVCDPHADEIVWRVQSKLKQLGYYDGMVDGQLGSQTAAAIRRYQIAERLKVTGNLNTQTLRSLGISAPRTRAPVRTDAPPGRNTLLLRTFSKAARLSRWTRVCINCRHPRGAKKTCDCSATSMARLTDGRLLPRILSQSLANQRRFSPDGPVRRKYAQGPPLMPN